MQVLTDAKELLEMLKETRETEEPDRDEIRSAFNLKETEDPETALLDAVAITPRLTYCLADHRISKKHIRDLIDILEWQLFDDGYNGQYKTEDSFFEFGIYDENWDDEPVEGSEFPIEPEKVRYRDGRIARRSAMGIGIQLDKVSDDHCNHTLYVDLYEHEQVIWFYEKLKDYMQ